MFMKVMNTTNSEAGMFMKVINTNSRDGFTRGGGQGGVLFFMIKQKIITDKMRYSNLSNNMMISEL
jgi:hypothetical protein